MSYGCDHKRTLTKGVIVHHTLYKTNQFLTLFSFSNKKPPYLTNREIFEICPKKVIFLLKKFSDLVFDHMGHLPF